MAQGVPGAPGGIEAGEGTRRRRDRRRGGRDRGERSEGHAAAHTQEPESRQPAGEIAAPAAPEAMLTAHEQPRHEHSADVPLADEDTPPSVWTPVMPDELPANKVPAPASALVSAEPAPAAPQPVPSYMQDRSEAPAPAAPRAADGGDAVTAAHADPIPVRPRSTAELPKVSLELPPDSGLVLIETARERVAAAESSAPAEPSRPRRVRPTRTEARDEPLQLVETVHKDSTPPAA
jgi:hypothetical protein